MINISDRDQITQQNLGERRKSNHQLIIGLYVNHMSSKTDVEVIIGGKVLTLTGYESEEYIQKVASYVNGKINECNHLEGFQRQSMDTQNTLLQLNMADDYLKAKKQIELLEEELQAREKEVYDLKHELVSVQMKLEAAGKKMEEAEKKAEESDNRFNHRSNNRR